MESFDGGDVNDASDHFFFLDEAAQGVHDGEAVVREQGGVARDQPVRANIVRQVCTGRGWAEGGFFLTFSSLKISI